MLPSVCAAMLRGCTAMPASSAAQKLSTLILPVLRSSDDFGDARRQRVVLHHGADAERRAAAFARPVGHLATDAQEMLHARHAFGERAGGTRAGPCRDPLAISSKKLSTAKALWPLPTPRQGGKPGAAVLDHVLGELVGDRILRDRRAFHHDAVLPRRAIAVPCRPRPIPRRRGDARRRACPMRRSRPRCDAPSWGGIFRTRRRPRASR